MESLVDSLYDYNYSGLNDEESSDEVEAAIVIETDQLKPVSHTVTDQSKLVSCTDSRSEEEEETSTLTLVLMNQLIWPLINVLFLK